MTATQELANLEAQAWVPTLLVGIAVAVVVVFAAVVFAQRRESLRKRRVHALFSDYVGIRSETGDVAASQMSGRERSWKLVVNTLVPTRSRSRLDRNLTYAGRRTAETIQHLADIKVQLLITGALSGVLIGYLLGGGMWLAPPILGVLAFYAPDAWLAREVRMRTEQIGMELPHAIDLLNLCVTSGQGLQAALQQVAKHEPGPVGAEFTRALHEMSMGVSRIEAFEGLSRRTEQPDLQRFANAIIQVDRLGIPLSMVLTEQARDMRERQRASAKEHAQVVGVKVLFPLMVCLLPALMIIVVGPSVLSLLQIFG